jgi:hypothetical protein
MLSLQDVKAIAAQHNSPAVSIFFPVHVPSPEARQDRPRLRNLARDAEELLIARGCRPAVARDIVQPAISLSEDREFWRHGGYGLALFLASGYSRSYRVPTGLNEEIVVGDHFNVVQLLRLLDEDGTFFILAVSSNRTRLLEASRWSLEEVKGLRLPDGLRAVKNETDYQDTVLGHPLARQPAARLRQGIGMVNNAGEDPAELHRMILMEYLTRVAAAVNEYLSGKNAPVILAAMPDIEGHIRPHLRFEGLFSEWINLNPDTARAEELRDRAYALVRPAFTAPRDQELDHFFTLKGNRSPKAGTEAADIVSWARYARVDTLFIADGAQLWGRIDSEDRVEVHQDRAPSDDDLVDRAAVDTLFHGGKAFVLPRERFPTQGPMAAIFRY